jgi:hypothetical protein
MWQYYAPHTSNNPSHSTQCMVSEVPHTISELYDYSSIRLNIDMLHCLASGTFIQMQVLWLHSITVQSKYPWLHVHMKRNLT